LFVVVGAMTFINKERRALCHVYGYWLRPVLEIDTRFGNVIRGVVYKEAQEPAFELSASLCLLVGAANPNPQILRYQLQLFFCGYSF